jgi:hypothetical protein
MTPKGVIASADIDTKGRDSPAPPLYTLDRPTIGSKFSAATTPMKHECAMETWR